MSLIRHALLSLLAVGLMGFASLANAELPKTLIVGTEATFPPFESVDKDGKFVGYDIDLVNAIGEKLGVKVQYKDMPFDSLIGAMQAGQINMIASGFSITEERKKQVEFSDAYMNAGIAIAIRKNETAIKGKDDLKGKIAAVQQGSTGSAAAEKLKEQGILTEIKYYPTVPLALMEMGKGGASVVISDRPTTAACISEMGDNFVLLPEASDLQADSYGFAFRKGNTELAAKVSEAMKQLRAEGFFEKLSAKYFKAAAKEEPKK